jgi:pyrimidine-nucleoside phosphorylase
MTVFSPYQLLNRKRRGEPLAASEIETLIAAYMRGDVADYQISAFLMAVAIHGLRPDETAALTRAMIASGETWNVREKFDFLADKHSTGGVGDKVSIALAPWVAACGVKIGMLSGRGLGHTGGTLDKLDAIPGFDARQSRAEFERCIETVNCAIATSTEAIAPADRRTYALRDVTGTVESLPLITASIMSKKLAMGASALVLDVKTGSGAFMRKYEDSRALAQSLVDAAEGSGTRVEAMITDMDAPLGVAAGNANEIAESIDVLRGTGPARLTEVTRLQAIRILAMSGRFSDETAAKALDDAITSGRALETARKWIAAQGGDASIVDKPEKLAQPKQVAEIVAPRSGFIAAIDTYEAGMLIVDLGAGRKRQDDVIDFAAGMMFDKTTGDEVRAGDPIARVQIGTHPVDVEAVRARYLRAVRFDDAPPPARPVVYEIIRPRVSR